MKDAALLIPDSPVSVAPVLPALKAWRVSDPFEDEMEIVFAATRGQAKQFAELRSSCDYVELRAVRAPAFDDAHDPPTGREYIERGWHVECGECSRKVVAPDYPDDPAVVYADDYPAYAFCSEKCRAAFVACWTPDGRAR